MKNTLIIPRIPHRETWEIKFAREAMRGGLVLYLGQSWLESVDPDFQPGLVKIGVSGNHLMILAELEDKWIHNPAIHKNELAFRRGDTFEIFLKAEHLKDYWELHVTPDNVVMQLHFSRHITILCQEALSAGRHFELDSYFVWEAVFTSQVQIQSGAWMVLAEIPLSIFGENSSDFILRANCARYDYLPGRKSPILSATAELGQPFTFHDQRGWSRMRITGAMNPPNSPTLNGKAFQANLPT